MDPVLFILMRPQSNILEVPQAAQTISFPFRKEMASKSTHLIYLSAPVMDTTHCVLEMKARFFVNTERLADSLQDKSAWMEPEGFLLQRQQAMAVWLVLSPESGAEHRPTDSVPKCSLLGTVGTLPAGQPRRDSCSRLHTRACSVTGLV